MKQERKHVEYFDVLRLIAALSVIYMHVASGMLREGMGLRWELANLAVSFCFTAVPIFFMISGYLLLSNERTRDVGQLRRRLPRILVPLFAWTVVSVCLTMFVHRDFSLTAFLEGMRAALQTPAEVPYWYLYTLAAFYMIAPILAPGLQALDRRGHRFVLAVIALIMAHSMLSALFPAFTERWLSVDLLYKLKLFNGHLCAFVLGYYLGRLPKKIPSLVLIAVLLATYAVIAAGTHIRTAAAGSFDETFYSQSGGFEVTQAACVFLLAKQNIGKSPRILRSIVPLLMGVYLMHSIVLRIFSAFAFEPVSIQGTVGITLLVFFVCCFAIKTVMSLKPFCYLFTGICYHDACRSCNWQHTLKGGGRHAQDAQ